VRPEVAEVDPAVEFDPGQDDEEVAVQFVDGVEGTGRQNRCSHRDASVV
jgi:hypothetical protein